MYADDCSGEFFTEKFVKARKEHKCCECRTAIPKGAMYQRESGKWDGVMSSYSTCAICLEIRKAFVCGTYVFEQLWEEIGEGMFPIWNKKGAWDCLAKLTTDEARAFINARYKQWRTDNDMDDEPVALYPAPEPK